MDKALLEIKDILMKILEVRECDYDKYIINEETHLVNKTGENEISLSSIDYVRFVVEIEDKYKIFYDFKEELVTVGDVLKYVKKYKRWGKEIE